MKNLGRFFLFFCLLFIVFSQLHQTSSITEASSGFQEEFKKSSPSTTTANDWSMLGHDLWHTGYSQSTSPDTNSTLWSYGQGSGNIAVANGRVYSGSMQGNVFCLDAFTGELKWNFNTGGYVYGAPAVSNGLVFIGSADSRLYCLNASTGAKKWSFATGNLIDSSPAISNDRVYFGSRDKNVYCLDSSGNLVWQFTTGDLIELSSPTIDDGRLFICSWDGGVYCLNANTGSSIWTYSTGNKIYGSPAVSDGLVFVGASNLYCMNETSGALVWSKSGGGDVVSPTAVYGDKLFWGSTNGLLCLNKYDGKVIWTYQKPVNPRTFIAVGGNKVFFLGTDKNLYCVDAENGTLVWYFKSLPTVYGCHPAIAYGNLYIASDSKLYCFGSTVQLVTYSLNLRTLDWSGDTLPLCDVTISNAGSKISNANGWANFTNILQGTYTVNIFWKGSKVNQTTLTVGTTDINLDVKCQVWDLDVNAIDGSGKLLPSENTRIYITFPNRTHFISSNFNPINYKLMNGTYYLAVKWQNSWVYGNTSVYLDVNTPSIDLSCKVFSLKLGFKDDGGRELYSLPSSYSLTCPNGSKIEGVSSFNFDRVQNGTYTVSDIMWQRSDITPIISISVVSSNTLWMLNCRVYDVDLKVVDRYNYPIVNSRVETRLANGTTRVYTTNSSGFIPHVSQLQTGQIYVSCSNETKVFLVNKPLNIVRSGFYVLKSISYQLTIQALDSSGNQIVNQPIEITFNNGTKRNFNLNGTGYWSNKDIPDGTMSWSIYFHGTKTNSTNIDLQKDTLITSRCQVYPLTLAFMDWNGTSTITPASYSITLPNGTIFAGRTALYYPQVQTGEVTISSIVWRGSDVTPSENKLALSSPTIWNIKSKVYKLQISVTDPTGITFSDVSVKLLKDGETFDQGKTDSLGQLLFSLPVGKYKVETIWKDCDVTPVDSTLTLTSSTLWNVKCRIYKLVVTVTDPLNMVVPDTSVELVRDGRTFDQGLTNSLGQLSSYLPTGDYEVKTIYRGLTQTRGFSLTSSMSLSLMVYLSNPFLALLSTSVVGITLPSAIMMNRKRKRRKFIERELVEPKIEVAGGYEIYGEFLRLGIKVANHTSLALMDATVIFEGVPEALEFNEPKTPYFRLGNIRPNEFQSAIFRLKPTRCVDGKVTGVVSYYDVEGKRRTAEIPPIHIHSICPFLTSEGVVIREWNDVLKGGLLDVSRTSFSFEGSPKLVLSLAEERVRNLILIDRDEKTVEGVYCGYACYFGQAKYGGYMFATEILVSGTESKGQLTISVYSNELAIVTGFISEIMEDVRKHIKTTNEVTILTGKCPECGGELDPSKADEKGIIRCGHCRCLNVVPPWMRIK